MIYQLTRRLTTRWSRDDVSKLVVTDLARVTHSKAKLRDGHLFIGVQSGLGSINRRADLRFRLDELEGGYLLIVQVTYEPSGWFYVFFLLGLLTLLGWLLPVIFYITQQSAVRSVVEATLERVEQETRSSASDVASKVEDDTSTQLARLAELHRSGALSDDEFARAKARVLSASDNRSP